MNHGYERKALAQHEIEAFVREADALAAVSHARRNDFLMSRWLPYGDPPPRVDDQVDPFGAEYRQWVLQQWRTASGRERYGLELEHDANVSASEEQLQRLYPFVSGDTTFIANYMMGVYFALGLLTDAPNRHMVEYGVGWGNTTVAMLQAGFNVLAVDIDPKWLSLLTLRAAKLGVGERLRTHHGEFGTLPPTAQSPGGVLFYECFHHALNHDDTLGMLRQRLADGGLVIFAAETIYKDFPHDWGLRLDGHSLWAIRRYGWMELAFSEDYFIRLTRRHHFALQRHQLQEAGPFGVVYKAVLGQRGVAMGRALLTSRETGWLGPEVSTDVHTRFTTGRATLDLPCGSAKVSLELKNWLSRPLKCQLLIDALPAWDGMVPAGAEVVVTLPHATHGYCRLAELTSETYVPAELGINTDTRRLGIAVGWIGFHA
jgi:hypothetical protein